MATLITGGTGFVGQNLEGDFSVSTKDANLLDFEKTYKLFQDFKPDTIIHAAARHGNYAQVETDKVGYYRENALININVFEAARLSGVENIHAFSSVTAFPDRIANFSEKDLYSGEPHHSCYPYAYAKRIIDILCRAYREQYGLNYNCLFLANAYGPYGKDNVIPTLVNKCLYSKYKGVDFEILGDGSPLRDFIYIEDVRRILSQLSKIPNYGSLIISSGVVVSIKEVVEEIIESVGFTGPVRWKDTAEIGQENKIPKNEKLMSLLPDLAFTDLRTGIKKTVEWHIEAHKSQLST